MAAFDNASLLLERSFAKGDALAAFDNIALVNFKDDGYANYLAQQFPDKRFSGLTYNFADYHSILNKQPNLAAFCSHQFEFEQPFDCVVIYFPKSKPEFEYLINNLFNHVSLDSPIYVVGDNKGGVKSSDKLMAKFCTKAQKIDAAKHCALYLALLNQASEPFEPQNWYKSYPLTIKDVTLSVYTLPGVFSHGSLDDGTKLLLESLKRPAKGQVLDFGCGAGLIGAFLAKQNPEVAVTGLDVSALAVESTLTTYRENGIKGHAVLSDGLSQLNGRFQQVYTNPPFHTGVKTNYAITEQFVADIGQYLQKSGELWLVANSFLKYQPLLQQQFGHFDIVSANKRFNVYYGCKTN